MNWTEECIAVVPCRNEAGAISRVVGEIQHYLSSVLVVDDGSTDQTGELARGAGANVIRHSVPAGKGAALRSGFSEARRLGFRWVLALDGDGQHMPADIPRFFQCASKTDARMVIGNRMNDPKGMPPVRRIVNQWMSGQLSTFCGVDLPDSQCGFRLLDLAAWSEAAPACDHFEVESELLVRFAAAGFKINFVPVQTVYAGEQSKIHPVRDTIRWFRWWMRIRREYGTRRFVWPASPKVVPDAAG